MMGGEKSLDYLNIPLYFNLLDLLCICSQMYSVWRPSHNWLGIRQFEMDSSLIYW